MYFKNIEINNVDININKIPYCGEIITNDIDGIIIKVKLLIIIGICLKNPLFHKDK
tara:strand:+ start:1560 stop:1727 length:168 start_codon:yes stop_codon:yes gene_type:complete